MAKVGDRVRLESGEDGVVVEALGLGCYMVLLEGWLEPCQVHERQFTTQELDDGQGQDRD